MEVSGFRDNPEMLQTYNPVHRSRPPLDHGLRVTLVVAPQSRLAAVKVDSPHHSLLQTSYSFRLSTTQDIDSKRAMLDEMPSLALYILFYGRIRTSGDLCQPLGIAT